MGKSNSLLWVLCTYVYRISFKANIHDHIHKACLSGFGKDFCAKIKVSKCVHGYSSVYLFIYVGVPSAGKNRFAT